MGTLASELETRVPRPRVPRIYADANIPVGIVGLMRRELRWDVLFVLEHENLRRASDREHFVRALELSRTIVTLDHDFCDDRAFPPDLSPGVIICSAADEEALARLLREIDRDLFPRASLQDLPLRGKKILKP